MPRSCHIPPLDDDEEIRWMQERGQEEYYYATLYAWEHRERSDNDPDSWSPADQD
jgi:hypothetical protein